MGICTFGTLDFIVSVFCTGLILAFGYFFNCMLTYAVSAVSKEGCLVFVCTVLSLNGKSELTAADFDICFLDCV